MSYKSVGVDIDEGNRAVSLMADSVASTRTSAVLAGPGGFAGMYSAEGLAPDSVLVASADGVGTKVELAAQLECWRGIGTDLVNHCVGDIVVHGARPLFFLDYIATARLVPEIVVEIVAGIADACRDAGCALLGGETAEMPGVYTPGSVDVVGAIVGSVRRDRLCSRPNAVGIGDVLIGVASSGPHTNGYSLIRSLLKGRDVSAEMIDWLLTPHRSYLPFLAELEEAGAYPKALAHITGGGLIDNLPRVLPEDAAACVELGSWEVPEPFAALVEWGRLDDAEAFRVWNMGIGMVAVVADCDADALVRMGHTPIGEIVAVDSRSERVVLAGSWQ